MTAAPPRTTSRLAGDSVLAVSFAAISEVEIWAFNLDGNFSLAVRVIASCLVPVASGALAYRRTDPNRCFWVNAFAVWALIAVGYSSNVYQWTNLVALYALASGETAARARLGLLASIGGVTLYFARFPSAGGPRVGAVVVAVWVLAWVGGREYGSRIERDRLRSERDVARRLAEAQEARLVLEEERGRIAHELHDIIGHTVNVMVLHAAAARRAVGRDPETVTLALSTIEDTGRSALGELDRVLALLRRDQSRLELLPQPGLADVGELARNCSTAGLQVTVEVAGDSGRLPASTGLAVYRIVQESLTNTIKHSAAKRSAVWIGVTDGEVDIRVAEGGPDRADDDPEALVAPERRGDRHGLVGMEERAALHDGSLRVGRRPDGAFVVAARLRWSATV
jgi:signal transduction histidine kinase